MDELEIYGQRYIINSTLKEELESYLSLKENGNISELTCFLTKEQVCVFLDKLWKLFNRNPGIFSELSALIVEENKCLVYLLLLCTVFKNSKQFDFDTCIDFAPEATRTYYSNIKDTFNTCCFFALENRYKEELFGSDIIGRQSYENKTEFVINGESASRLEKEILIAKDWDSQRNIYEMYLGYPNGYLNTCKTDAIYQLIIDGKKLKEDEGKLKNFGTRIHFPNGDEAGVNEFWIAGGVTRGGLFEMVIDNLPNLPMYVIKVLKFPIEYVNGSKIINKPRLVDHKYRMG